MVGEYFPIRFDRNDPIGMKNLVNVLQLGTSLCVGCVGTLSESRLSVVATSGIGEWLSDFRRLSFVEKLSLVLLCGS